MADITELIFEDHEWFRRQFLYLDEAKTADELTAIWEPLATRLDTHAEAEEQIFYPELLRLGKADPVEETEDAVHDHNKIREAVADSRKHPAGSDEWFDAVNRAREENGEHLDEEEREGLPDFKKNASIELRHQLAMEWIKFWYRHPEGKDIDPTGPDPDQYLKEHTP